MKRRNFLRRGATLLPLPLLLNNFKLSALAQPFLANELGSAADDRVLVLIQLDGGNDGLNTLVPLDQYDNLMQVRPNLVIPDAKLLKVTPNNALHPAMSGIRGLYEEGKVGIIQGVGYENPNRSHFRSTDIWNTGSSAETVETEGWLGRFLDTRFPDFPDGYPNADQPAPFAVVMGTSVSETCQGRAANFSIAINDIDNVSQLPGAVAGAELSTPYGAELEWLRQTIEQSNQYAATITEAVDRGSSTATYDDENELAQKLRSVARLISGGLGTKIYIVQLGGFDTHANQVSGDDPSVGTHANLLKTLSDAVASFQQDLASLGIEERVVGMTYSEFGRRIRSNASNGSDHGDAAPLFVFGSCVNAGITGQNPEIDPAVGIGEAVPFQYDFRNVYGSVLMDWFGVGEGTVQELLLDDFAYVPVVNTCNSPTTTSTRDRAPEHLGLTVAPNPARRNTEVVFATDGGNERVRLSLFDSLGRPVRTVMDRELPAGEHRVPVYVGNLPAGTYTVHAMLAQGRRAVRRLVVVR